MIETRPGDLVAEGHLAGGVVLGMGVALAVGLAERRTTGPSARVGVAAGVFASLLAAAGAYVCTPDTELALGVLGAVIGAGAAAIALGLDWWGPSMAVTGALVFTAVHDGIGRASAIVGTIAVAVVHLAAQHLLHQGRSRPVVLVVATAAIAACSRVAGLAPTAEQALLLAAAVLALAAVALAALGSSLRSPLRRGSAGSDRAA